MSKILDASCVANVVTAGGLPVVGATILSQGVKSSSGLLLMDGDKKTYVTSSASDIKDLITSINDLITKINTVLTGLDAVSTSPGSVTAAIALVTVANAQLALTKELLK